MLSILALALKTIIDNQHFIQDVSFYTEDAKALSHILHDTQTYPKSEQDRFFLGKMFGYGRSNRQLT